jgi:hypothetical protein
METPLDAPHHRSLPPHALIYIDSSHLILRTAVECQHSRPSCGRTHSCVQRSQSCERASGLTRLVTSAPPQSLGVSAYVHWFNCRFRIRQSDGPKISAAASASPSTETAPSLIECFQDSTSAAQSPALSFSSSPTFQPLRMFGVTEGGI